MRILKNRTVLGIVCIALALIICFGLTPLFNKSLQSQVEIIRITKDVKKGGLITADMTERVKVGGFNLPGDVLKEQESVVGKYAKTGLNKGDYVLAGKLSDSPLAEFEYLHDLESGRLAISISIKYFSAGLSGKLEAGDIVSIIVTDYGDLNESLMPPELQYVKVIAVTDGKGYDKDQRDAGTASAGGSKEKPLPATVTLLALPRQALQLAELESNGKIHCALVYRGENPDSLLKAQDEYIAACEEAEKELLAEQAETGGEAEILEEPENYEDVSAEES